MERRRRPPGRVPLPRAGRCLTASSLPAAQLAVLAHVRYYWWATARCLVCALCCYSLTVLLGVPVVRQRGCRISSQRALGGAHRLAPYATIAVGSGPTLFHLRGALTKCHSSTCVPWACPPFIACWWENQQRVLGLGGFATTHLQPHQGGSILLVITIFIIIAG